jgi:hypothetical protein
MPHQTYHSHKHTHTHQHTHQAAPGSVCVFTTPGEWSAVIGGIPISDCASWGGQVMTKSQYAAQCSQLGSGVHGYKIKNVDAPDREFSNTGSPGSVLGVLDQTGGMCTTGSPSSGSTYDF